MSGRTRSGFLCQWKARAGLAQNPPHLNEPNTLGRSQIRIWPLALEN